MHLHPSIEIIIVLGSTSILITFPYVLYRFPSARVTKPLIIHLLAYATLTPLTWIGMTGSLALTGAWFGFLPPDPSALIYSAFASILPASALTAGSLNPPPA